jgi:chromosomal replication initiator protein
MAHSTIYNKDIDLELAQRIVKKVVKYETKAITIDDIMVQRASITKLNLRQFILNREKGSCTGQTSAMFLAKKHTDILHPE